MFRGVDMYCNILFIGEAFFGCSQWASRGFLVFVLLLKKILSLQPTNWPSIVQNVIANIMHQFYLRLWFNSTIPLMHLFFSPSFFLKKKFFISIWGVWGRYILGITCMQRCNGGLLDYLQYYLFCTCYAHLLDITDNSI